MSNYRCDSCEWTGDMPLIMGGGTTHWYGCPACKSPVHVSTAPTTDDATVDWLMNAMGMKQ